MTYEYYPRGVCSRRMLIDVDGDTVTGLTVEGGCHGNLQGISSLVKGMKVDEVISRLDGIRCGAKSTSCPAQLANALKEIKNKA